MQEKNDPVVIATARWVFSFIKFQLRCGQTLQEIEIALGRAIANGDLHSYMKVFADLQTVEDGKTSEQRVEQ